MVSLSRDADAAIRPSINPRQEGGEARKGGGIEGRVGGSRPTRERMGKRGGGRGWRAGGRKGCWRRVMRGRKARGREKLGHSAIDAFG